MRLFRETAPFSRLFVSLTSQWMILKPYMTAHTFADIIQDERYCRGPMPRTRKIRLRAIDSPSPECYTVFRRITIYSDTLH